MLLELVGYKRFALNNIHYFKMEMSEIVQLILAKNGAGKSSLMWEISPCPADANDYLKDGSKTIVIKKNSVIYTLKSSFGKKTHHSFLIGDFEMNDGGTVSVQRKLVEEYFSYSEAVHEIVTGRERFSLMSVQERRKWLIRFSPIDFDYALDVFGKLKKQYSNINGALNTAKKRLVLEVAKSLTAEEEEKLRAETTSLQDDLDFLQRYRAPLNKSPQDIESTRRRTYQEIESVSDTIIRMQNIDRPDGQRYTIKEVDELIEKVRRQVTVEETLIKESYAEHTKLSETIAILKKTGEDGVEQLRAKSEALEEDRIKWLKMRKLQLDVDNPTAALAALESVSDTLSDVFSAIPSNENRQFNQATLQELKTQADALGEARAHLSNKLAALQANRSKMDAHRNSTDTTCPKCRYTWVVGYSEKEYDENTRLIEENTTALTELAEKTAKNKSSLDDFEEYRKLYGEFNRCVRNWPVLRSFWDHLLTTEAVFNYPRTVSTMATQFRQDLIYAIEAADCQAKFLEMTNLMTQASQVGDANLTDVAGRLEACSERIDNLTGELMKHKNKLNEYTQYRRQIVQMLELGSRLQDLIASSRQATSEQVEALRRQAINSCINAIQVALGKKADALQTITAQKVIINDLNVHIEKYTLQEATLKIMLKELSPTEGLIAESLNGSIKNFVTQMNVLIKKIWTYPMKVLECAMSAEDGDELDYKFRVMVKDMGSVVPDIKYTSSGQREVIDMVFKVVAMKHLGLAEAPLFLDEFGAAFDAEHRASATQTIKSLMDTTTFSQLYMISHYETSYGSFSNAQICVLDPRGISVPSVHNQHVTIE